MEETFFSAKSHSFPENVHDLGRISIDAKLRRKHNEAVRAGGDVGAESEVAEATPTAPASMTSADAEADVVTPIGCCRGEPGISSAGKTERKTKLGAQ